MGTPLFPGLGRHCSVSDCKLLDFLPFTCDRCDQVFCLEHRSYNTHECPNANQQDVTVLICPLCAKSVRLVPNEDPNITWESHVNTDCDPTNYQAAVKKKRCPVPRCKETLGFSNTIRCRDCTKEHCLKHRFGPDHNCPGPQKTNAGGFPFVGLFQKNKKESKPARNTCGPSWWSTSLSNAASSVRASAEASMEKLSIGATQAFHKAKDGMAPSSSGHVERVHPKSSPNKVTLDICPKCNKAFRDPVLLVEHVERDHGGTSIAK
ncbi:Zinc finger AN1 and C2H2 domain-containing stress-associated protein 13 [Acorus gramineus]|uniref:Zinc finger AN1 and C2H2 domain-containing stress-associated protein 13 n=1 Tax=Acorus gramineus TaxID=55184 RepID=A0AAV9A4G3_ACOGR|nr:Zinc finger AN1 and C2H2 domain-containing stress-associated protein 13 [Acorus gramineus]